MQIEMSRDDAEKLFLALNHCKHLLVTRITKISRARSWRESEKAMAIGIERLQLERLNAHQKIVGEVFHIGGY